MIEKALIAKVLVHHGGVEIGRAAVRTFDLNCIEPYNLEIHSDGSLTAQDQNALLGEISLRPARLVLPEERAPRIEERTRNCPKVRKMLEKGGHFHKISVAISAEGPYFFFDSDILWVNKFKGVLPESRLNAFSLDPWSWYFGSAKRREWVKRGIPMRVNSGFYFLGETFPVEKLEKAISDGHYDPEARDATDQEIFAYLFPDLEYYDPGAFVKTRAGIRYPLDTSTAVALHFAGGHWKDRLPELAAFYPKASLSVKKVSYRPARPITYLEIVRMLLYRFLIRNKWIFPATFLFRKLRTQLSIMRRAG